MGKSLKGPQKEELSTMVVERIRRRLRQNGFRCHITLQASHTLVFAGVHSVCKLHRTRDGPVETTNLPQTRIHNSVPTQFYVSASKSAIRICGSAKPKSRDIR